MSESLVLGVLVAYFAALGALAWLTGRRRPTSTSPDSSTDNRTGNSLAAFFVANRAAPWYVVAFGMIGTSLSGVTFISVPGAVAGVGMTYMQVVVGYVLGYIVIARVLLPLYYRLRLTSIYGYLAQRYGPAGYRTGAAYFIISRLLGSAARLYLAAVVFQSLLAEAWGVPFWLTAVVIILLIMFYTGRGGMQTIVWTDTLQTAAMLLAVVLTLWQISSALEFGSIAQMASAIDASELGYLFDWAPASGHFFLKDVLSGALICIVMTGLDQDQMQKNLSIRSLGEAQRNMYTYGTAIVFVNLLFVSLGVLLYAYAAQKGLAVPERGDLLYGTLATQELGTLVGVLFVLGLTAAAYSSADGSLTALTTSYCVDFLAIESKPDAQAQRLKRRVHWAMAGATLLSVLAFHLAERAGTGGVSVIDIVLKLAGYTYGPLLGLYGFGLITKQKVEDGLLPIICILSPLVCLALNWAVPRYAGYAFGYELILINGLLTALGCWLARAR